MQKKRISTAHDAAFKGFMTKIENARDFFDIHLPNHIKSLCDFNTLALTNSSFIDKQLRSRLSDVLYSVQTTHGKGYLYLLVEHQSTPDKLMAWRLMHYAFLAMNQHLQQGNKTPLLWCQFFFITVGGLHTPIRNYGRIVLHSQISLMGYTHSHSHW